ARALVYVRNLTGNPPRSNWSRTRDSRPADHGGERPPIARTGDHSAPRDNPLLVSGQYRNNSTLTRSHDVDRQPENVPLKLFAVAPASSRMPASSPQVCTCNCDRTRLACQSTTRL